MSEQVLPKLASPQTAAEAELARLLVESLNLEGLDPAEIDPEALYTNDFLPSAP